MEDWLSLMKAFNDCVCVWCVCFRRLDYYDSFYFFFFKQMAETQLLPWKMAFCCFDLSFKEITKMQFVCMCLCVCVRESEKEKCWCTIRTSDPVFRLTPVHSAHLQLS